MPLFEFSCSQCGEFVERYFASYEASELPQACSCGHLLQKELSRVVFRSFEPFYTQNLTRDGSGVYVRDRAQLRELCREHGAIPLGDDPIRAHFGTSEKSRPRPGEKPSKIGRKPPAVQRGTQADAARASQFAERTDFGQRSAR